MSNATATFYWQPEASPMETITLPWVTELTEETTPSFSRSRNGVGSIVQVNHAPEIVVKVGAERFGNPDDSALERQLYAFQAHMQAGGLCGFSRYHARAWSTIAASGKNPARGDTTIYGRGNGWTAYNASGTLAVGDEVVIEGVHPELKREIVQVGSLPVDPPIHVLLDDGCIQTYKGLPAIYRHRWFWPILALRDPAAQMVTTERRMNFTLSAEFVYQPGLVLDAWSVARGSSYTVPTGLSAPTGATHPPLSRMSLAQLLSASRRSGIPSRLAGSWP